ncbi:MAG: hypothetical protein CSA36_02340 [Draconibacterium sp.]|nr:MAG: hypothetical protein CSA36_02340 [Draconibacterium sp.]
MNLRNTCLLFFFLFFLLPFEGVTHVDPTDTIPDIKAFCSERKGFNLTGKFDVNWSNDGFHEKDFSVIHGLGFNFVRVPVDYRTYTLPGNWNHFVEEWVTQIDKAINFGQKHAIHVCLNLHRAPGYCVNSAELPAGQDLDLWTDTVAQNAFVRHWRYFADRYKNVPASMLSFNLVNEPSNVSEEDYVAVMQKAIDAIHAISPNRLIFVDGLNYGRDILLSLKDEPNIAQAIHSYDPFELTHYKASWVGGSNNWPVPVWPMLTISNYLYGPYKGEYKSPLILQGEFEAGTEITVNVKQVSIESTLRIKADNQTVLSKKFICGPVAGNDFTQVIETEWGYQNISNKDFSCTLTTAATSLAFDNASGDWMTINSITIKTGNEIHNYKLFDNEWGKKQQTYMLDSNWRIKNLDGSLPLPFENYQKNFALARDNNIPIMVLEFGVHNKTPHDVSVAFLDDLSAFFRENETGWALWNFTGSFGIMNSNRSDCEYETYQGYHLDREMLEALTEPGSASAVGEKKKID